MYSLFVRHTTCVIFASFHQGKEEKNSCLFFVFTMKQIPFVLSLSKDERVSKYKKVHPHPNPPPSRGREMNPKDEIPAHQRHTRADTLARLGLFDIDQEHLYLICGEVRTCLDISGCPSF